jgi:hypothetical protein
VSKCNTKVANTFNRTDQIWPVAQVNAKLAGMGKARIESRELRDVVEPIDEADYQDIDGCEITVPARVDRLARPGPAGRETAHRLVEHRASIRRAVRLAGLAEHAEALPYFDHGEL